MHQVVEEVLLKQGVQDQEQVVKVVMEQLIQFQDPQ